MTIDYKVKLTGELWYSLALNPDLYSYILLTSLHVSVGLTNG
jgi:hypothetical protein